MLKLAGGFEGAIKGGRRSLQELVAQGRAKVGDKQVYSDVVESRSGAESDKSLGRSPADGDRKSTEARDVSKLNRKRRVRERESGAGESFKVVDSLDDARIKRIDLFGLTLMKVSEVDGGIPGSASGAESSKEGLPEGVPVIAVDAAAFESIKPAKSVAAEGIKNEGHSLVGRPGRGSAGTRDMFDPMLGSELIFDVAGVKREFGQVRLAEVVDIDIDHSDEARNKNT
jgi:hypothetical protein